MERRDFVKGSLAITATVLASPLLSFASEAEAKVKVFVAEGEAMDAVRRVLSQLGGVNAIVKKGDRVLVKANFSFSNPPKEASTTSPEVVKALVLLCKEAGADKVTVLDNTIRSAKTCLERSGIEDTLKDIDDVKIATPSKKSDFKEVEVEKGKSLKKVGLAKAYFDSDVYINLPIAKSHSAATVSFGLKNQMGLIYDRGSFHWKHDLHQAIADLGTVARPRLTILDATRCLKTGGPGGPGEVVELGRLACSEDPVALDAYAATLVEWNGKVYKPEDIGHIKYAWEHGLGEMDLRRIEIIET